MCFAKGKLRQGRLPYRSRKCPHWGALGGPGRRDVKWRTLITQAQLQVLRRDLKSNHDCWWGGQRGVGVTNGIREALHQGCLGLNPEQRIHPGRMMLFKPVEEERGRLQTTGEAGLAVRFERKSRHTQLAPERLLKITVIVFRIKRMS